MLLALAQFLKPPVDVRMHRVPLGEMILATFSGVRLYDGTGTKRRNRVLQMKPIGAALPPLLLALTACSGLRPGGEAAVPVPVPVPAPAPAPAPVVAVARPLPSSPSPAAAVAADSQIANNTQAAATSATPAPESPLTDKGPVKSKQPPSRTTPRPTPAVGGSAVASKQTVVSPAVERSPTAAPLDIAALEQRLRETNAIGVFTKLSLKNQVDDLLAQFRAHFRGNGTPPLSGLRQHYDLLMLKVLSLLQDSDPTLAQTIGSSREAIWGILSDPTKLAAIS